MPRISLAVLVVLLLAACGGEAPAPAPGSVTPTAADPAAPPETVVRVASELPDVVARVNGEDVTGAELEQALARVERQLGGPLPEIEYSHVVRELLDQLIAYRLLTQEAEARGLEVAAGDLDAELALIRNQFPTEDAFAQALAAEGTTPEAFRVETARQLLVAALIDEEVAGQAAVTPEQITTFYEENPEQFRQGPQVRARHILTSVPQGADAPARDDARARAEALLAEIQAGGDFEALAREHSDDPGSGQAGGDLGYFGEGDMVPPFEEAALALAPGETSGLVESQFGFHIIRVVDRQAPRMIPLDDVRAQAEQFLQGQNQQAATQAFIDSLRAEGTVDILI